MPGDLAEWVLNNGLSLQMLSATRLEILKHLAVHWDAWHKLVAMPEPLRGSFYDFNGLRHLVQRRVEELRSGEEDEQLKRSNELISQYDNHNLSDLPPFNKINSPQWWRNLPVEVRKELIHERCPPEKIEKWGIGSIDARVIDLLVKYDVSLR